MVNNFVNKGSKHFPNSCKRPDTLNQEYSGVEVKSQLEAELNDRVNQILNRQFPSFLLSGKPYCATNEATDWSSDENNKIEIHKKEKRLITEFQDEICFKSLPSKEDLQDVTGPSAVYCQSSSTSVFPLSSKSILNCIQTINDKDRRVYFADQGSVQFKTRRSYAESIQLAEANFGQMSMSEKKSYYYFHTVTAFTEALTTGKMPDGSFLQEIGPGKYLDNLGFSRSMDGPFWPLDYGPLHPNPVFLCHSKCDFLEPMLDTMSESDESLNTTGLMSFFSGQWNGPRLVYDAETFPKHFKATEPSKNCCPSLEFESRFESGNLLYARQIGQCEYELVIRNDLYTSGHTQWFYFRIKNMIKGIKYNFKIVNFTKKTSLYSQGMQPLMYSEYLSTTQNIGWFRTGSNVSYSKSETGFSHHSLDKDQTYYTLKWCMEFPQDNDTCYLAHCYPYTYSNLQSDLTSLVKNNPRLVKLESLCSTRAGNTCYLLTINDQNYDLIEKRVIILTARIHPGETNSSLIMKGLLDYIAGSSDSAKELRKNFIFKVIPMLNPDGVIVGNYRCSLSGRDLNRNFANPNKTMFPTIYYLKQLIDSLQNKIVLYCDLHGHSQKQNVFMYGCTPHSLNESLKPEDYLKTRIIPWLMSQQSPEKFAFDGCSFHVSKSKESTARVVMFKQFNIINSFTLEATFCGTTVLRQQFNMEDFQDVGKSLCKAMLVYEKLINDKEANKEVVNQLATELSRKYLKQNFGSKTNPLHENRQNNVLHPINLRKIIKAISTSDKLKSLELETDSDTESEPEASSDIFHQKYVKKKSKAKNKEHLSKNRNSGVSGKQVRCISAAFDETSGKFPLIKTKSKSFDKTPCRQILPNSFSNSKFRRLSLEQKPKLDFHHIHVNRYEGRSNGGIPCFTEERFLERVAKRKLSKEDLPRVDL